MSLASAWAVVLRGVDGVLVEIEAHVGPGLPGLQIIDESSTRTAVAEVTAE